MAHFRGSVQGSRGEASRLGDKAAGLTTEAASWEGKVVVRLWYNDNQASDWATVELAPHCGRGIKYPVTLYDGPVSGDSGNRFRPWTMNERGAL